MKQNSATQSFPIIGLGASAGGLDALKAFFGAVSKNSGMAYIVGVHMKRTQPCILPDLLQSVAPIPVLTVKDNQLIEPDHVYVIPPEKEVSVYNGRIQLFDLIEPTTTFSIDLFFESLAQDQESNATAIVLSGTGTDGTCGLKAIQANEGLALAQDENSAEFDSMPKNAVKAGAVDMVLPPEEMPKKLEQYFFYSRKASVLKYDTTNNQREWLNKIFAILRTQVGHDFSAYKVNTILRRLTRRMALNDIDNHETYIRYMRENPRETDALFRELLIGVTNFFRDTDSFVVLKEKIFPELFKQLQENTTFRVWVPGCSTGEEVYSLAIILKEFIDEENKQIDLQLFGTDIDKNAIDKAREGLFPATIAADVDENRLERYFTQEGNFYRIRKEVRECIIFSLQNVMKDPPFSHLHLLCCRNLLIYLNGEAQKKLFPLFHYTLNPGGILVLGSSETIGGFSSLFKTLDKKWKIYKRMEVPESMRQVVEFPNGILNPEPSDVIPSAQPDPPQPDIGQLMRDTVLDRFAPTAILVNAKAEILHVLGRTTKYLETPNGPPTNNLLDLAREGLRIELASALRSARASSKKVTRKQIILKSHHDTLQTINLHISPQYSPKKLEGNYLVIFEDVEVDSLTQSLKQNQKAERLESSRIADLERELLITRESYQTAIEELESSNEELKSTNEEMQSSNEELQSTNEELESSKEELQSLNEELQTVNTELQNKVEELSAAHDDIHNLINSTAIATIFVDNNMRIRRFTAEARTIVNLIPSDIGRPLQHVMSNLTYTKMIDDLAEVLKSLVPKNVEVQTTENRWYNMRIAPYRTIDNRIDGAVLTFVDIITHKQGCYKLAKVFTDATDPIIVKDLDGNIIEMNDEAVRLYGWKREELLNRPFLTVIPQEQHEKAREQLQRCKRGEPIRNIETLRLHKSGNVFKVLLTLSLLRNNREEPFGIANVTKAL